MNFSLTTMKFRLLSAILLALFFAGCCGLPRPVAGKVRPVYTLEGPPSAGNTGSVVMVFGTPSHPPTKWWTGGPNPPPQLGAVHNVSSAIDEVITGIPAGRRVLRFSTSLPATAPKPTPVYIPRGKTVILSVEYREPL